MDAAQTSEAPAQNDCPDILMVEAFYCGSHKQLMDCLMRDPAIADRADLFTMSGKKWHWRARTSSLHLSRVIQTVHKYRVLFASSVLNLAELVALRSDLAQLHKVLYFHENQLQYPVRKQQDRDFQYGYNQILSCLVADVVVFNSSYNMESFLSSINSFLKLMPDYRPKGLADQIRPKCRVIHFPVLFDQIDSCLKQRQTQEQSCGETKVEGNSASDHPASKRCRMSGDHVGGDCGKSVTEKKESNPFSSRVPSTQMSRGHSGATGVNEETPDHHTEEQNAVDSSTEGQTRAHNLSLQTEHDVAESAISHNKPVTPDASNCGQPMQSNDTQCEQVSSNSQKPVHIVWPHRWEHDKDPQMFFETLFRLQAEGEDFRVSVLGETFTDVPAIFGEARDKLKDHILTWGFQEDKAAYYRVLQEADVVVSTSKHEFFGVAMLEAVYLGCYPLCPKSLVYPEIYPDECLYSTPAQLYKKLRAFCRRPHLSRTEQTKVDMESYSWGSLRPAYLDVLQIKA